MHTKNLSHLTEGESAMVTSLSDRCAIKRRFRDIGLVEGTEVKCVKKSPFGDPVAFLIRGAVIAIRAEDAKSVLVH